MEPRHEAKAGGGPHAAAPAAAGLPGRADRRVRSPVAAALRQDISSLAGARRRHRLPQHPQPDEAEKLCAQVGVIRQGKLMAVGSPDELRSSTGAPEAEIFGEGFTEPMLALLQARPEVAGAELQNSHLTLRLRGESKIGPLVSLIVGAGGQVEEIRRGKASLEEVFLTLMEEEKR